MSRIMNTLFCTAKYRRLILAVALCVLSGACGSGDGSGFETGTLPGDDVLEPKFDSIQTNIFDQFCISCHIGATAPGGLRLDAANSFALLVGVASTQEPSLLRVEPSNPDQSYLIQKLEGTAGTGGQMPLGTSPLPQSDIDVVRQWITDGALRDPGGQPPSDPIRVSSMSPLPDTVELRLPMTIMAIFDRELNASTVNNTTFLLERSGGDGTFGDGNEVAILPVSVTVPATNPTTAIFDLSTAPAVEDVYQVTLIGTGPAVIGDLDANALDGEFVGTFPSGDGLAGGDFVAHFQVEGIQPTLQSIQDNVFATSCAGCHTGPMSSVPGDLPAGLDLTTANASFDNLVNVPSRWDANIDLVEPGDSDNSFLIQKLEGTTMNGERMPLGLQPLDQGTIDAIREWIDTGANP